MATTNWNNILPDWEWITSYESSCEGGITAFTATFTRSRSLIQRNLINAIRKKTKGYSVPFLAQFLERDLFKFNCRLNAL